MRRLINQKPDRSGALLLGALPFLLICILYLFASHSRLTENPNDKVLPALSTFAATIHTVAFEADKRTGDILLWRDSAASLTRLGIGVAVSALAGLLFGIATGALPFVRASLAPFIAALSLIPPLALLPVLFIVFGLGELSKVVLIVFGIAPFIMRDVAMRVGELPSEQIIKAQTLGASSWQVITRVILPQIHAAPARCRASFARRRLAVSDCRRSDCRRGRLGLPDISGAPVSGDGSDSALCGLDHLARVSYRLPDQTFHRLGLPLVSGRRATFMIKIRKLWKEYGNQVVLENVNLDVDTHEFITIVGASGCGKTTFLRMLLGEEQPTRGEFLIDGTPLPEEPGPDRGIVFQRYSVFPHLTVLENVLLGLEFSGAPLMGRLFGAGKKAATEKAKAMLEAVGLYENRDKYPSALSGGMQQRLSIAQSIIKEPKILLLDEPFGALDPGISADMHRLILKLWDEHKMTILMTTHDLKEGFALGTRLLVFDKVRLDPQAPGSFGASITYDIPLHDTTPALLRELDAAKGRTERFTDRLLTQA